MYTKPEVRQNTKPGDENHCKWAVVREDKPSDPGDVGFSFPGEDMEFLNTDLEWQPDPFVMNTEEGANNLLKCYSKKQQSAS